MVLGAAPLAANPVAATILKLEKKKAGARPWKKKRQ